MFRILAYTFRPPFSEDSTLSLRRNRALEGLALTLGLLAIIAGLGGGALTVLTTVAPGWPMGQP